MLQVFYADYTCHYVTCADAQIYKSTESLTLQFVERTELMNDKQIECFLEAGQQMSFTKAAQNLYLPQPAVSRYIAALEQELGVVLFTRNSNRKIEFTEAGTVYFNFFQRTNAELVHIKKKFSNDNPTLRLGYNTGWNIASFLPEVIAACKEANPDFQISFKCLGFKELLHALDDNDLDVILTTTDYLPGDGHYEKRNITTIPRNIIYSKRLPNWDKIKGPEDFAEYTFYMIDDPKIGELCKDLEIIFRPYNYIPKFSAVSNLDTVLAFIENGLGVAILDGWYQNQGSPEICKIELNEQLPISLGWRRSNVNPNIDLLYTKFREQFHLIGK